MTDNPKTVAEAAWQPIETRPTGDDNPFLVLLPKNDVAAFVIVQVTNFEGEMYPDFLDGLINWDDRVTTATHWTNAILPPNQPLRRTGANDENEVR